MAWLLRALCAAACLFIAAGAREDGSQSASKAICPRRQSPLNWKHAACPPVLSETSPPETWKPWTHRPYCFTLPPKVRRDDGEEEEEEGDDGATDEQLEAEVAEGKRFCVFTSSFFGNHGVSIIAQPETATDAATLLWGAYESGFPNNDTVQRLNLTPAIKVVDMPEKGGKGVIATRHIPAAETFMVDYAVIMADLELWGEFPKRRGSRLLRRSFDQLVDPDQTITTLSTSGAPGHVDQLTALIWSNTFHTDLSGVASTALFPLISRMNHACNPNAVFRQSTNGLTAGVAAFRDIEEGDEITLSYIPLTHTHEDRQRRLHQWGFDCNCALCSLPDAERRLSDSRRTRIAEIRDDMMARLYKGDLRGAARGLEEALAVIRDENLVMASSEVYESLARIYWALGDRNMARHQARMSIDLRNEWDFLEPRNRTADVEGLVATFNDKIMVE